MYKDHSLGNGTSARIRPFIVHSSHMMELGFSFLFICYNKLTCRLLIIVVAVLDLFCTTYSSLHLPPYPEMYSFLTADRLLAFMSRLQMYGGCNNLIISVIWFYINLNVIYNVEVELNFLGVSLIRDSSARKCSKEISTVFLILVALSLLNFILSWTSWKEIPMVLIYFIHSAFIYGCSGVLSCSLHQLASFYNDFMRFNKYEDSILRCQRIAAIFEKICHLFKLPMFLIISWSFLLCICDLYALFNCLLPDLFWTNVVLLSYIPYVQYPIFMVIRSCNELNKKVITK